MMNLPSFLWLWRIAAWSMGLSLVVYAALALTGAAMLSGRYKQRPFSRWRWAHMGLGLGLMMLVLGLLAIGIVGTLGHYGSLGHSIHGLAGLGVVTLTGLSAGAALQIRHGKPWARTVHLSLNGFLGVALLGVLWSGWVVVQKYLP